MTLKSVKEDLQASTLRAISGKLAKLAYLASIRLEDGTYSHWGLSRVHGEASAQEALAEAHRGVVINYPLAALAHLGLGRAYAISGNTAKAKAAYQDFFTLWKDADLDIPILKQAKAEYAKL